MPQTHGELDTFSNNIGHRLNAMDLDLKSAHYSMNGLVEYLGINCKLSLVQRAAEIFQTIIVC